MTGENTGHPWLEAEPEELLDDPGQLSEIGPCDASKALAYSVSTGTGSYDQIGYRYSAANPFKGDVPLQTVPGMLRARHRDNANAPLRRVAWEQSAMWHRAIDMKPPDGKFRYQFTDTDLQFFIKRHTESGAEYEERWVLGLNHAPTFLMKDAQNADTPQTVNQQYTVELPQATWVPLDALINQGRFMQFQDWDDQLTRDAPPGTLCLFVSHRWRTPENPDKTGQEAALIAWQLIDQLSEAVLTAHNRGLHVPRKKNPLLGAVIGLAGSELAEAIIVNVLRLNLTEQNVAEMAAEALGLETQLGENSLLNAKGDIGLRRLQGLLDKCPLLTSLSKHIQLWYDFSCLPQPPRTKTEQTTFEEGLGALNAIQLLGRTVVLIDEPENYLSRAWCTVEAMLASNVGQDPDALHATIRETSQEGDVEQYITSVIEDRPHIIRRAILDTELYSIQTPKECFQRLGINLNDPADLPFLYQRLTELSRPVGIHTDPGALVTGSIPLPRNSGDDVALLPSGGRVEVLEDAHGQPLTLDWTLALAQQTIANGEIPDPHIKFEVAPGMQQCHVIALGCCEGDAALFAHWVIEQRASLERVLDVQVSDVSWLANDIAPVGHRACGDLHAVIDTSDVWLIVAQSVRMDHGHLPRRLLDVANQAGRERAVLLIDLSEENLMRLGSMDRHEHDDQIWVPENRIDLNPVPGGVFAAALSSEKTPLFLRPADPPEPLPLVDQVEAPAALQAFVINSFFEGNRDLVQDICTFHTKSVVEQFESWLTVPKELRGDDPSVGAYVQAIAFVAETMESLGYPELRDAMTGKSDGQSNPIDRWNRKFQLARVKQDSGDVAGSNELLTNLLDEMETSRGSGVDQLRPKVLGMMGANFFKLDQIDESRDFTQQALEYCKSIGDGEGIAAYRANLSYLDEAEAPSHAAPVIAKAQQLADQGWYQSSNAALEALIGTLKDTDPLSCKVWGLHGSNHHWLGNYLQAERSTKRAVELGRTFEDGDGVRIYTNNLEFIQLAADLADE